MFARDTSKSISEMSDAEFQDYTNKQRKVSDRLSQITGRGGSGGSSSSTSSNSLSSFLGGDFGIDSMTDRAKDLARFRLGLDKEQASFSGDLREKEASNNFGRQTAFEKQQQEGRVDLTNITQNALTGRLNSELQNRLTQQQKGFDQSNLQTTRAMNLASKRLGQ